MLPTIPTAVARPAQVPADLPSPAAVPSERTVERLPEPINRLDITRTIRALTPLELEGSEISTWYVVQLMVAATPFDPEALPNLDIFNEYRLYCVTGLDQGRVLNALRLGFFGEELAAQMVACYLTEFYESATVKRVSVAERERFARKTLEARKDIGATGRHSVIEITADRVARKS